MKCSTGLVQVLEILEDLDRSELTRIAETLASKYDVYAYRRGPGNVTLSEDGGKDFSVTLVHVGPNLILAVRLLRQILGTGLKDSKEIAESVPRIILGAVSEKRAREVATSFEGLGAKVEIREAR